MITLNKYKKITEILNNKLKKFPIDPYFLSIKYLYVIKEHEAFVKNYNLENRNRLSLIAYLVNIFPKLVILLLLLIFLLFKKKNKYKFNFKTKSKIIIISHYIKNFELSDNDFYFGKIKFDNISILRILHKPLLQSNDINKDNYYKTELLNYNLGFYFNLKIIFTLLKKSYYYYLNNKKIFDDRIALEYLSVSTFTNIIFYNYCIKLFKYNNFNKAICTFEGHPFERLFYLSSENSQNSVEKVGYIHTPYSELQNSAYLNLDKALNPSTIFTYGDISYYLNKFEFSFKTFVYGSNRYLKEKINHNYFTKQKNNNILLLPDGVDQEIDNFLDLAEYLSKKFNNINFIIRLHPVSKKQFIKKTKKLIKKTSNLSFSSNSLSLDSKKCKYAIYRSSSSIIQSIGYGCLPLSFNLKGFVYPDPLFRIKKYILGFSDKFDAFRIFENINKNIYNKSDIKKIINHTNLLYNEIDTDIFINK